MCRTRIRVPDKWWGDYLALLGCGPRRRARGHGAGGGGRLGPARRVRVGLARLQRAADGRGDPAAAQRQADCARASTIRSSGRPTASRSPSRWRSATTAIEVDLRDNPDCQPFGLNLTEATARSAAMLGVMNAVNGYAPANAGAFRRLRVLLRENCCVGIPRHPASCSVATCNLVDRVGNAVQRAIAEMAEGYGLAEVGLQHPRVARGACRVSTRGTTTSRTSTSSCSPTPAGRAGPRPTAG